MKYRITEQINAKTLKVLVRNLENNSLWYPKVKAVKRYEWVKQGEAEKSCPQGLFIEGGTINKVIQNDFFSLEKAPQPFYFEYQKFKINKSLKGFCPELCWKELGGERLLEDYIFTERISGVNYIYVPLRDSVRKVIKPFVKVIDIEMIKQIPHLSGKCQMWHSFTELY